MPAACFYIPTLDPAAPGCVLDEANSRHALQVLRMKTGDLLRLTDGRGHLCEAVIAAASKKTCEVSIRSSQYVEPDRPRLSIGLALLKNAGRFEWFLEKATELGAAAIFPILSDRTEKQQFRRSRMQSIVESALVQSQQAWIPELSDPMSFKSLLSLTAFDQKLIAHCGEGQKIKLAEAMNRHASSRLILIGPEGDFTEAEIEAAAANHFVAVSLGDHRLRSETAAVAATAVLKG